MPPTHCCCVFLAWLPERGIRNGQNHAAGPSQGRNLPCLHADPLLPPSPPSKSKFSPGLLPRRFALHSIPALGNQSFDLDGPALALAASNLQCSSSKAGCSWSRVDGERRTH
ncbi:hypothetical protein M441DRAFT_71628 [Trichoderma asperellum CBS 433.97]|uniref:Uncharacterized protein n=1 Tax=Trichoderma asperellum (strain ATCC 204424 / CBS 433.97 / NBRC 101777) TaxID=1042311 RepID=A0A2T3Z074_TRIA4|nr:hypothetical protein M441DRAFT_71628 [Trichoderma asperellum CBS 433.97]PTB38164.1 hypothetical protein M441DRAFT_71628 [Trichoderma asperellum CBS 433.97]